ncbi:MAG: heavy metal translocating P-type ATPase [Verrucomicrobia bacterium]|nr:heavy metal translocating P-type ATPase [Verrucomicrobiota bacterium]
MRTAEQTAGERVNSSNCGAIADSCTEPEAGFSRAWLRVGIAAVFAGQSMVLSLALNMTPPTFGSPVYWVLHGGLMVSALLVLLFLSGSLIASTLAMLRTRRLSIDGLFMLSLGGAFVGSLLSSLTGEGAVFYEVVSVVIMIHALGRVFSERSLSRMQSATENLRETFEQVRVLREGSWKVERIASLQVGESVQVEAGAAIGVDGLILEGSGYVNESALSGEPLPVVRRAGDRLRAGTYSVDGNFVVRAERALGERELDGILTAVRRREGRSSLLQAQADRLVQFFLPLVAGGSFLTALYWFSVGDWTEAVFNAMAVLLVACPCALGLATPVAIWQGSYRLSQSGLASRDGALIDTLALSRRIFFDKTGTLSEASLQVTECCLVEGWRERSEALLEAVRALESKAGHPVARSLVRYCGAGEAAAELKDLKHYPGVGIGGRVKDLELCVGEAELVPEADLTAGLALLREQQGKRVYVFVGAELAAIFVLREHLREGVDSTWAELAALGVATEILTGDPQPELDLPDSVVLRAGLLAEEKTERVMASKAAGERPLFVGDGINDSGAMVEAAASIAMGSGAELARSSAAALLVGDQIAFLPEAIRYARAVQQRLRSNLVYAALYNTVGMTLAATGNLHPVAAACIMFVSSAWVLSRASLPQGYKVN